MAYTARTLVNNAWYLSGIVSREFQTVSGQQSEEGLTLLNNLLAVKTADKRLIPYFTVQYLINEVIGQEGYFVPNLISIECITFNIGEVRFSMTEIPRIQYYGAGRVDNIQSLPFSYHFERQLNGGTIYVYFLPAANYPLKVTGKFSLSSVTLDQDLSLTLDKFYIEYLRYALASYICSDYNTTFAPQNAKQLRDYEQTIIDISPYDLTTQVTSTLSNGPVLNWGYINISPGWTP